MRARGGWKNFSGATITFFQTVLVFQRTFSRIQGDTLSVFFFFTHSLFFLLQTHACDEYVITVSEHVAGKSCLE